MRLRDGGILKWLLIGVAVFVLLLVGLGGVGFYLGRGFIKRSAVLPMTAAAMSAIQGSSEVSDALGTPIKRGHNFTSNYSANLMDARHAPEKGTGNSDISFDILGPKGAGTAKFHSSEAEGVWHIDHLEVVLDDSHDKIDLSDKVDAQDFPITDQPQNR